MKKLILLFTCTILLLSFCACTPKKPIDRLYIDKAKLTDEEKNIAQLLGNDADNTIYDFVVDDTVNSMQINTYKLNGANWEKISGGGKYAFRDTNGRVALTFETISEGYRIALQSKNENSAVESVIRPTNQYENLSRTTSFLCNETPIEYEKEIPLVIQILTNKNTVSSYNVDYFFKPEEYEKLGYEHVFAITVQFSQKELS